MIRIPRGRLSFSNVGLRWPALLMVFAVAAATRIAAELPGGFVPSGDWYQYSRVAENILRGCGVSLSVPGSGTCVPHFGGNGLPGYPFFIAAVWSVFGSTKAAVLWAQVVVSALAVPRLAYGASRMSGPTAGLLCGLVAALSPLQAFMVRFPLTEALTIAAINWLLAELALSVADRRLRVLPLACVLTVGLFLRLDFAAFLVPVAVVGIWIHGISVAALRGGLLAVALCVPLGLWSARNVAVGISVVPPVANGWMLSDGSVGPLGFLDWVMQWVTIEEQRNALLFFGANNYDRIQLLSGARLPAGQDDRARELLAELRTHTGQPFPADTNTAFAAMAAEAAQARSLQDTIVLRARQTWGFWRSWAQPLPNELRPPDTSPEAEFMQLWIKRSFTSGLEPLLNTLTRDYRFLLGITFILSVLAFRRGSSERRLFTLAAASVVIIKTALAVAALALEQRYTVTAVPMMEFAVALSMLELVRRFRRRRELGAAAEARA